MNERQAMLKSESDRLAKRGQELRKAEITDLEERLGRSDLSGPERADLEAKLNRLVVLQNTVELLNGPPGKP